MRLYSPRISERHAAKLVLAESIHDSGIAEWMRGTVKAMPLVEAIHVLGSVAVFGTILIVDLRLLGVPDTRRSFTRIAHEVLPAT